MGNHQPSAPSVHLHVPTIGHHNHHHKGNILVLGSTGYIGQAALTALAETCDHYQTIENIYAGMRNINKAKELGIDLNLDKTKIKAIKVDMGNTEEVSKIVKTNHITTVFVIPPASINRSKIALAALKGIKLGGAKNVLTLSVLSVPYLGTILADQFKPIEDATKNLGLTYTIIRLPLVTDNIFVHQKTIKETGKFYGMLKPDIKYSTVTTADAGVAACRILIHPNKYKGKTFNLVSDTYSELELAKALTAGTGKSIEYIQVPIESVKKTFLERGFPEWQADGVLELYKMIDLKLETMLSKGDLKELDIIPTKITEFTKAIGPMFK